VSAAAGKADAAGGAALSAEERLAFELRGYLVVEDALAGGELAAARRAADEAEAAWRADPSRPGCRLPEFVEIEGIMEYHPLLFDLVEHPGWFPRVRELLGGGIGLVDHSYYVTPPGGALDGSAWHSDLAGRVHGVDLPRSLLMVRVMIALEDVNADGGATLVLPGSHRWGDEVVLPPVATPEEMPGAVALACRAGTAYFFNGHLRHSPGTNRGAATRRMLLYNYGHKWMRMWRGHEPSERLRRAAATPMRRQLLGLTPPYRGPDAEPAGR
jgi:ectoine hydroxylase-related dioxygenase (phytanoyl-CoA dioxygenase family)